MSTGSELLAEAQRLKRVPGRSKETVSAAKSACEKLEADGADGKTRATALCLAGNFAMDSHQWSEAAKLFEQALGLDSDSKAASVGAAVAKGMVGGGSDSKESAMAKVKEVEEAGGTGLSGDDLIMLGRAWVTLGKEAEGLALINKAWSRGAGGEATYELGLAAQRKYCAGMAELGPASDAAIIDEALTQYKKCRRDARALFNSGMLAEEKYFRSLMWRSSVRPEAAAAEDGMPFKAQEMGEMSAHSMEDEIAAIASSAGLFEPTLNDILKALIEEHRLQQERGDSFQSDYVMQLYHFKSRQLLAAGGKQSPQSTKTDPSLKAASESYAEALKTDKTCGALVYVHLARTQALMGKFEQAVGTLKQNKEPEPHPAAQMYRALYESPPTAEKPCPKQLLDASEAVTACVAEAVKAGPGIPNSPLSGAICHVFNVDLVRAACALAQAHNSAGRFAEAKNLMSGLAGMVPKARDAASKGTVAYQELRLAAAQAQEALLVSLAGLKETETAAPLYEAVYPVLSDNQRWTIPEIDKLITVCKVGVEVCPLLAAAHSRLAAAEFLRVDYDPAMSKPSNKDAKKEALERCVKLLRAGLALEGKPSREPSKAPPPAPAPAPAPEPAVPEAPATPPATSEAPPPEKAAQQPTGKSEATAAPAAKAKAAPAAATKTAPAAAGRTAVGKTAAGTGSPRAGATAAAGRAASKPAATTTSRSSTSTAASKTPTSTSRAGAAGSRAGAGAASSPAKAGASSRSAATAAASPSKPAAGKAAPAAKAPALASAPAKTAETKAKAEEEKAPAAASAAAPAASPAVPAPPKPESIPNNPKLVISRIELGKVIKELHGSEVPEELRDEMVSLYHEVMEMDPKCVDAYTGVQAILAASDPLAAIEEMGKYPGHDPPNFDDSYIHMDILQLYMQVGRKDRNALDTPQLEKSLFITGKVMGFPGIEKYVDFLDGKGRWGMLRRVHAAINGVPESEMKDFFEAKGWPADEEDE